VKKRPLFSFLERRDVASISFRSSDEGEKKKNSRRRLSTLPTLSSSNEEVRRLCFKKGGKRSEGGDPLLLRYTTRARVPEDCDNRSESLPINQRWKGVSQKSNAEAVDKCERRYRLKKPRPNPLAFPLSLEEKRRRGAGPVKCRFRFLRGASVRMPI